MTTEPAFVPSLPKARLHRRLGRSLFVLVPFLVWLGSVAGVLYLAQQRTRPLDYPGLATIQRFAVFAPSKGTLEALLVAQRDTVQAGQLIGRLDGADLALRTRLVRNRIAGIRAELERERALHDVDRARDQIEQDNEFRRYQRDVENARLDSLDILARLEENRIRLEGLRIDLQRQESLSTQQLFSEAELIRTRTEVKALGERIRQSEAILKSRSAKLTTAESRLTEFRNRSQIPAADMAAILGTHQWRIAELNDELELIALERTRREIRAPAGGLVVEVLAHSGEAVAEGRQLLTIVDPLPESVIAYLPPGEIGGVTVGQPAILERSTDPGRLIHTKVARIGSTVVELPPQVTAYQQVREWGMPVYLEVTPEMASIPGESVRVRLTTPDGD